MTTLHITELAAAFAEAMDRLAPFEPSPAVAVAVSGGADSMALALLARGWVHQRHGTMQALVVDHGLRSESAQEASTTVVRLDRLGIAATLLPLTGLQRGPALAERARIMRYQKLTDACRCAGSLHLLLGHHAGDQVETMVMRALRASLSHGLAAMPAVLETSSIRLLRPLLTIRPEALRQLLRQHAIAWVEDPSNHDMLALRPRLRHRLTNHLTFNTSADLAKAARRIGVLRAREETATATEMAHRVSIWPEGYARLAPGRIDARTMACLLQTIAGAPYAPGETRVAELAAQPRPTTLAGVRIVPAGRFGEGLLVVREEASIAAAEPARSNVIWDGRFRLIADFALPAGCSIGKLGQDAALFRRRSSLPSVVLRSLPAIRCDNKLAAVPHLTYSINETFARIMVLFTPPRPLAGATFLAA